VPASAVIYGETSAGAAQTSVQIVVDGKIAVRSVKLGLVAEGYAEIQSGLAADERVVLRAAPFLRDGDRVREHRVAE
jgi:HlyD family secretion protein